MGLVGAAAAVLLGDDLRVPAADRVLEGEERPPAEPAEPEELREEAQAVGNALRADEGATCGRRNFCRIPLKLREMTLV